MPLSRFATEMVPWPIALLSVFYGIVAAASAAAMAQILSGASNRLLIGQFFWFGLSAGAMCGLALLKPWGRRLAIWTSALLVIVMLAVAGILATAAGRPLWALLVAFGSAVHILAIRYLQRPTVKAYFGS